MEKEGPPDQPGQQSPSSPTDLLTVRARKGRSFTAGWVKKAIGTEMRAIMGPPLGTCSSELPPNLYWRLTRAPSGGAPRIVRPREANDLDSCLSLPPPFSLLPFVVVAASSPEDFHSLKIGAAMRIGPCFNVSVFSPARPNQLPRTINNKLAPDPLPGNSPG
ncbi:hypothetical protein BO78DRAFT_203160 [Aspergillus sclerotiicarbonarius CBS 121057]|uniref:Uncharacterized protein n=1 Tax=Aspergillus sclerotiicarbonarius (strain CBS 121057 / IBT 28362) TaxID=1448318 RepID=A0A319EZD8_ASPSB|nr:hypothetical protein BO78DRAFT_203160 [Aspergillus sclerotiicarbonarius CBS 121057]